MGNSTNTYRKSFKGIAIFGSLQVFKILLSILTTKVSAIFLGPSGNGIYGLITSTLSTTEAFASCGLGTSAVKDISQANAKNDQLKIAKTIRTLNSLVWITGLIGTLIIILLSSKLSILSFGNKNFTNWFIILSITILFNQLTSGQGAILTGLQRYKLIARQRITAGSISAFISIILYYLLGINGICPVILLTALCNLITSYICVKALKITKVKCNTKDTLRNGIPMLKMGISIGLSYALTCLSGFIIRAYISNLSDIATVGLFTASFSLINTYLGLVFTSIESDFYPRLSSCINNSINYKNTMIYEMELLVYLLTPLISILIVFSQPVLAIFYSTKFYAAKNIICWSALSMLLKVPGWSMSIGVISHGNTNLYLKTQLAYITYQLGFNIIGFKYWGLTGLGISFSASQLLYSLHNLYIQYRNFNFTLNMSICLTMLASFLTTLCLCIISTTLDDNMLFFIGGTICISVIIVCLIQLNKRLSFVTYIKRNFSKH